VKNLRLLALVAIFANFFGLFSFGPFFGPLFSDSAVAAQQPQLTAADKLLSEGYQLYSDGKYREALAKANQAIALNPKDSRPLVLSGLIHAAQMKLKEASALYAKAIPLELMQNQGAATQRRVVELYLLKAETDLSRGANAEVVAATRKALESDPNSAKAYGLMADAARANVKVRPEVIAVLRSALKLNPNFLRLYPLLAGLLGEAKDYSGAEEVYRQAMAIDPKHMLGRLDLAHLLLKQGKLAEAREVWEGRTSDEDNFRPQFSELLRRAENLKRATEVLAQKPGDPDALVEMGLAVMEGDHWVLDSRQRRALVYFRQALKLKPDHARAQYGIVKAYIQIADADEREQRILNAEMAKLKKLDAALAAELAEYRKTYVGGIVVEGPVND
jgi:tetratricopeptide (TPR) repeat protein